MLMNPSFLKVFFVLPAPALALLEVVHCFFRGFFMNSNLSGSGKALQVIWKSSDHFSSLCVDSKLGCNPSIVAKLLRDFIRCQIGWWA